MFIFGYDKVLERLERVIQQLVELQTADNVHIFIYNRSAQADIYVETIRYGNINHHICSRINVLYRLAENKEEGTGICTRTG